MPTSNEVSTDTEDPAKEARSPLFVGSVEKMFRILHAFDSGMPSLSLTQIAAHSGINLSATQRFVHTLQTLGYLRKDPQTRRYGLTPKLLNLGTSYLRNEELARRATPYIRQIADRTGETVSLLERDGVDLIHVIRYGALRAVSTHILLGSRRPALLSAGGRAIVAWLPADEASRLIEESYRVVREELPDRSELQESLQAARRDGFSVVTSKGPAPTVTVAAPVLDSNGSAMGAVEFTVSGESWEENGFSDGLIRILLETTQALSLAS